MVKKQSRLSRMRANPVGDWVISDVEKLCREHGMIFSPPSGGSHHFASSPFIQGSLSVPARRPIKSIYIKQLVSLCDAHIEAAKKLEAAKEQEGEVK
jgi:UDP-N-acetylmuramyl pentapeptide synthase